MRNCSRAIQHPMLVLWAASSNPDTEELEDALPQKFRRSDSLDCRLFLERCLERAAIGEQPGGFDVGQPRDYVGVGVEERLKMVLVDLDQRHRGQRGNRGDARRSGQQRDLAEDVASNQTSDGSL